jgi:hypothetical protein
MIRASAVFPHQKPEAFNSLLAVSLAVSSSRDISKLSLVSVPLKGQRTRVVSIMSRGTSYLPSRVVPSSALSVVPQSQVCLAFLFRMCSFYGGLLSQYKRAFHTWHCLQVLEQLLADGNTSPITNTADLSPARIGRRKTLLAYTVIFAVGAVRCFRFVPSLLGPC